MGADAVKFQMRNNKILFSLDAYNAKYNSEKAFAETYGKHREKLELSLSEFKLVKKECKKNYVKFMATPFDESSLEKLCKAGVDIIKIASFDLDLTKLFLDILMARYLYNPQDFFESNIKPYISPFIFNNLINK